MQIIYSLPLDLASGVIDKLPVGKIFCLPTELVCIWLRGCRPVRLEVTHPVLDNLAMRGLLRALPCIRGCTTLALNLSGVPPTATDFSGSTCRFLHQLVEPRVPTVCGQCCIRLEPCISAPAQVGSKHARDDTSSAKPTDAPSPPDKFARAFGGRAVGLLPITPWSPGAPAKDGNHGNAASAAGPPNTIMALLAAALTQLPKLKHVALCKVPARSWSDVIALRRALRCIPGVTWLELSLAAPLEASDAPLCVGMAVLEMVCALPALDVLVLCGFDLPITGAMLEALAASRAQHVVIDSYTLKGCVPQALRCKVQVGWVREQRSF